MSHGGGEPGGVAEMYPKSVTYKWEGFSVPVWPKTQKLSNYLPASILA